ncbi:MAG: hypothetical protein VKK62_02230 [Synechococcaceae cyanobacterium]|nr:hypothetical protein [Synechococcaceae cyanobacterium]
MPLAASSPPCGAAPPASGPRRLRPAPAARPGRRGTRRAPLRGLPLLLTALLLAAASPALAAGPSASSTATIARQRQQAQQAIRSGNWRKGCPLLRRTIDAAGGLYARSPSPALLAELRQLSAMLQPCIRRGL